MRDAWRALLTRTACGEPVFSFDETRRWRQSEFEQFSASGLLRELGQAQFVTCDACDNAHSEEVIWRSSVREPSGMRAYIPCPVEMSVHVPAERLRQWSVDTDEMAGRLRQQWNWPERWRACSLAASGN
jgi:hypothetical protein